MNTATATFTAQVKVAGETREATIVEKFEGVYSCQEAISYKHRTGTKTYGIRGAQVVKGRDGIFKPVQESILRRPALPVAWGDGTTNRSH